MKWLKLLLLDIICNLLLIGATTLLTETYESSERFKTQALNDFIVFSMVSIASLSAGILHHQLGWQFVNYMAIPAIIVILISLIWLYRINRDIDIQTDSEILTEARINA